MTKAGLICTDVAPCGGRGGGAGGAGGAGGGRAVTGGGRQKYTAAAQNDRADGWLPSSVAELSRLTVMMHRKEGGLLCSHWGPTLTPPGSRSIKKKETKQRRFKELAGLVFFTA